MMNDLINSINKFYENNKIDPTQYTASEKEAYLANKMCDSKIDFETLRERVEIWSSRFAEEDKKYFLLLLENYIYLSDKELRYRYYLLLEEIMNMARMKGVDEQKVYFITVPSAKGVACGGDYVRKYILDAGIHWGISKKQILSDLPKVSEKDIKEGGIFVFVDDILGTGFTTWSSIKQFIDLFSGCISDTAKIIITGMLITKGAKKYISKKANEESICIEWLVDEKRYIGSCMKGNKIFNEKELADIERIIKSYEEEIGIDKDTGKEYVMGFRACKLILSFYYNTPNNTLCTFWRYKGKNIPLFPRDENMSLTLSDLKRRRIQNRDNAYLEGRYKEDENA